MGFGFAFLYVIIYNLYIHLDRLTSNIHPKKEDNSLLLRRRQKYLLYGQLCLWYQPPAVSTHRGEIKLRLRKLEIDLDSTCVTNGGSDERMPPSEKFQTALRRRDTLLYSCCKIWTKLGACKGPPEV